MSDVGCERVCMVDGDSGVLGTDFSQKLMDGVDFCTDSEGTVVYCSQYWVPSHRFKWVTFFKICSEEEVTVIKAVRLTLPILLEKLW